MHYREIEYKIKNNFRDKNGQAHFPDSRLGPAQITPYNPWSVMRYGDVTGYRTKGQVKAWLNYLVRNLEKEVI